MRRDDLSGLLADLARQVDRLRPSHRDPERFHLDKSDIVDALRRAARDCGDQQSGAADAPLFNKGTTR